MILLQAPPSGWITLIPGVRARFDPISRPMVRRARRAAQAWAAAHPDMDADEKAEGMGDAFTASIIAQGMREWEGIGDADGHPIQPGDEGAMDMFLDRALLVDAADAAYVSPWVMQDAEKNVSAPSPDGISERATQATTIATCVAAGRKKKAAGAKNAHTANMNRARKRAKASGTS